MKLADILKLGSEIVATAGTNVGNYGTVEELRDNDKVYVKWQRGPRSTYDTKNIALASTPHKIIPAEIKGTKLIKPKYIKL